MKAFSTASCVFLIVLGATACRFAYDNPAEKLIPGELRGRAVQEREGEEAGTFDPIAGARVRLRGLPFVLDTRDTGFFAFLDLPTGDYHVLLDAVVDGEHPRATQRRVTIGLGPDGQPEGVSLNDVPLLYTASVSGRVLDESSGKPVPFATVVDDVSLLSVTADENGDFSFPSLSVGDHVLRAAGVIVSEDDTSKPGVGGTLTVRLGKEHERMALKLDENLELREAKDFGRLQLEVGIMASSAPPSGLLNTTTAPSFGLDEIAVYATSCNDPERTITLASPSSNGSVDDPTVPEGCWNIHLEPPEGPHSDEYTLQTRVENVVVVKDADVDLGKLLLVSESALRKSRHACGADADCGEGGTCNDRQCTQRPEPPDPCLEDNGGCHPQALCMNDRGVAHCECGEGWIGDGRVCDDLDECAHGIDDCAPEATCTNTEGSWTCECPTGFEGDGTLCSEINCDSGYRLDGDTCVDVDECAENLHDCHHEASCTNTVGGWTCVCNSGFEGNGHLCDDVDECALRLHDCDTNADCMNEVGGFTCACNDSFEGDGNTCVEIDECAAGLHDCHADAVCTNLPGIGFECACRDGFMGDGRNCTAGALHLSARGFNTCAIRPDHSLWCWGENENDWLGDSGLDGIQPEPSRITGPEGEPSRFHRVAMGKGFACAIDEERDLWCWGHNDDGQLGNGTNVSTTTLTPVKLPEEWPETLKWSEVVAGDRHACALTTAGEAWCWGDGASGATGSVFTIQQPAPTQVHFDGTPPVFNRLTAGAAHNCALDVEDNLWCWGKNDDEQTGKASPATIANALQPLPGTKWLAISAGSQHTCAVTPDRELWCWGYNGDGNAGQEPDFPIAPTRVGAGEFVDVVAGDKHTCARRASGELACFGLNTSQQLGFFGDSTHVPTDVLADAPLAALGETHSCAVTNDGLFCWGANTNGALGVSPGMRTAAPQQVEGDRWTEVSAGPNFTCGIRETKLVCWGAGNEGQLGLTLPTGHVYSATPLEHDAGWRTLSLGSVHGCGLRDDDTMWCWGPGQSRWTDDPIPPGSPQQVSTESWQQVSAGNDFTCAVRGDGTLWCAGNHSYEPADVPTPDTSFLVSGWVEVDVGVAISAVATGYDHACALTITGFIGCWGNNDEGQLGRTGESLSSPEPVPHPRDLAWTQVTAGLFHTCALDELGDRWCWGSNAATQLGSGNTDPMSAEPIRDENHGDWVLLEAGGYQTCGIQSNGTGWCWGLGAWGVLGNGFYDTYAIPAPTQLTGLTRIATGGVPVSDVRHHPIDKPPIGHTCAIRDDETLWCWGAGTAGQRGDRRDQFFLPTLLDGF